MYLEPTSGERPVLSTSRCTAELLRRAVTGHGPHVLVVSRAAQAMRAHAERCREHPRSGPRTSVRWSGTDFAEYFRAVVSILADEHYSFEIV